jgi:hypothetical protein
VREEHQEEVLPDPQRRPAEDGSVMREVGVPRLTGPCAGGTPGVAAAQHVAYPARLLERQLVVACRDEHEGEQERDAEPDDRGGGGVAELHPLEEYLDVLSAEGRARGEEAGDGEGQPETVRERHRR